MSERRTVSLKGTKREAEAAWALIVATKRVGDWEVVEIIDQPRRVHGRLECDVMVRRSE